MPNWCSNRIRISATAEMMAEIKKKLFTEDGKLTFNILIPMPAPLKRTRTGFTTFDGVTHRSWTWDVAEDGTEKDRPFTEAELTEIEATGFPNWYEWSCENWGTKWDVNPDQVTLIATHDGSPSKQEGGNVLVALLRSADIDPVKDQCTFLELTFNTAWAPPTPWVKALRRAFPNANISAFFDEPGMDVDGYY